MIGVNTQHAANVKRKPRPRSARRGRSRHGGQRARAPKQNQITSNQITSNQTKPNQTKPHHIKPNQTKSNQTKPNQTKPNQTTSHYITSNQIKPNQTKPNQTTSHHITSNQTKPNQTTSHHITSHQTKSNQAKHPPPATSCARRPGVATSTSTGLASARHCTPGPAPPTTPTDRNRTWCASCFATTCRGGDVWPCTRHQRSTTTNHTTSARRSNPRQQGARTMTCRTRASAHTRTLTRAAINQTRYQAPATTSVTAVEGVRPRRSARGTQQTSKHTIRPLVTALTRICATSSRVGTSTRARGRPCRARAAPGSAPAAAAAAAASASARETSSTTGARYASVFPVPAAARRPQRARGHSA